ncbi:MAG: putative pre6S rRNA nuclease [Candidatus Parcubacteria bacterium]|jgi:putative Holliday junction resolvase|nr:putative pre6S rRNA nuclease [Candidatus Parcubacteria bacterium]
MGIDYGSKKVGIALSDEAGVMGFPHGTLLNTSELVNEVVKLVSEKNVNAAVIGESRNFSGGDNPVAAQARAFAQELAERTGIPVHFEPETYTTQEARRYPDGTRMPGSPDVDASAAALILTGFLERQPRGQNHEP